MCGIIGHVGPPPGARALEPRLRSARDAMTHRGPDDAGLWTDDHAALGSRRLAILDLSPSGHMPMASADGHHVLVFNGAIYNYVELRAELAREVAFRSTGDTEVILQGFRVWGWDRLLDRLDGMFAFALWDMRERTLYAARDRMGEKPFFYARHDDGLSFASTLTALVQLRGGPSIVDVARARRLPHLPGGARTARDVRGDGAAPARARAPLLSRYGRAAHLALLGSAASRRSAASASATR